MDVDFSNSTSSCSGTSLTQPLRGFTLVELVVTLTIAAIVIVVTIPSFAVLIQNSRLTTSVNNLSVSLYLTRSEAIKRNRPAIICKGTPITGCDNARQWHEGWIIFVDLDGDKIWDDDEPLAKSQDALPSTQTLRWGAFPSSSYVIYYPNGTASSNGTFTFCDERGSAAARALIISRSGRVRFSKKSSSGNSLECPS